jgi:hypothetical protein
LWHAAIDLFLLALELPGIVPVYDTADETNKGIHRQFHASCEAVSECPLFVSYAVIGRMTSSMHAAHGLLLLLLTVASAVLGFVCVLSLHSSCQDACVTLLTQVMLQIMWRRDTWPAAAAANKSC